MYYAVYDIEMFHKYSLAKVLEGCQGGCSRGMPFGWRGFQDDYVFVKRRGNYAHPISPHASIYE